MAAAGHWLSFSSLDPHWSGVGCNENPAHNIPHTCPLRTIALLLVLFKNCAAGKVPGKVRCHFLEGARARAKALISSRLLGPPITHPSAIPRGSSEREKRARRQGKTKQGRWAAATKMTAWRMAHLRAISGGSPFALTRPDRPDRPVAVTVVSRHRHHPIKLEWRR